MISAVWLIPAFWVGLVVGLFIAFLHVRTNDTGDM